MAAEVEVTPSSPRRWLVAAVAVGGLLSGLGLVRLTIKDPPALAMETGEPPGEQEAASNDAPAEETPAPSTEELTADVPGAETPSADTPSVEIASAETPSAETPSAETPSVETPSAETPSAPGTPSAGTPSGETQAADPANDAVRRGASELGITRGRLAYIQCGGADEGGRCPRDRDLEAQVWQILEALPACPTRPRSTGTGDIRVHFRADETTLRFRDWGDSPLPLNPLRSCLATPIEALRTNIRTLPVVVSFRFRLVESAE
ncbi:MAG: hypothetical protein AAGE52_06390 [Myxococcota bacterium]